MGVATCTGFPSGSRAPSSSPEWLAPAASTLAGVLSGSSPGTASELLVPWLPLAQKSSADGGPSSEGREKTLCRELEGGNGPEMELRCRKGPWGSSL